MGEKITNDNIDEYITAYIDCEIKDSTLEKQFQDILQKDVTLFKKYRSELLTKNFFQTRLKNQEVPISLYSAITRNIDSVISSVIRKQQAVVSVPDHPISASSSFPEYLSKIISVPVKIGKLKVPRYAFAIVLILIVLGIGFLSGKKNQGQLNPYIANGTEKSIMIQALNNFHKIEKGEIKPQCNSGNETEVKNYLKNNLDYEAYIPCIENCELIGAVCNEFNGQKVAHLVYRSGKDIFYICETPSKSLNHQCFEIPEQVQNEIISKKFYMCDKVDLDNDCTMLMWFTGNICCTSVSNMPKQKMYAAFTNFK